MTTFLERIAVPKVRAVFVMIVWGPLSIFTRIFEIPPTPLRVLTANLEDFLARGGKKKNHPYLILYI